MNSTSLIWSSVLFLAHISIFILSFRPYHNLMWDGDGDCLYFCVGLSTGKVLNTDWLEGNNKYPLFEPHLFSSGNLDIQFIWVYLTQVAGSAYQSNTVFKKKDREKKEKKKKRQGERSLHIQERKPRARKTATLKSDPSLVICAPKFPQWALFWFMGDMKHNPGSVSPQINTASLSRVIVEDFQWAQFTHC